MLPKGGIKSKDRIDLETNLISGLWTNSPASLRAIPSSVSQCPTLPMSKTKNDTRKKNVIFISIYQQISLVTSLAPVNLHVPVSMMLDVVM